MFLLSLPPYFYRWLKDNVYPVPYSYKCYRRYIMQILRTIQGDIQMMWLDKLGYNAHIEVYDYEYYRYAVRDYFIMNMPLMRLLPFARDCEEKPQTITFWSSGEQSKYILRKPLHPSQKLISRSNEDGSCVFSIAVVVNFEMYSVFLFYGSGVKILYPRLVRKYMQDKLKETLGLYE